MQDSFMNEVEAMFEAERQQQLAPVRWGCIAAGLTFVAILLGIGIALGAYLV